jgi:hypothetical protein
MPTAGAKQQQATRAAVNADSTCKYILMNYDYWAEAPEIARKYVAAFTIDKETIMFLIPSLARQNFSYFSSLRSSSHSITPSSAPTSSASSASSAS